MHIAVKLKRRLPEAKYGSYGQSCCYRGLFTCFDYKFQHGLRLRYINHKDKQKFQAIITITFASQLLMKISMADAKNC